MKIQSTSQEKNDLFCLCPGLFTPPLSLVIKIDIPSVFGGVSPNVLSWVWRARAAEQGKRTSDGQAGQRGEGRGGGLGRSEIHCTFLAGVQEVGNRLLLN